MTVIVTGSLGHISKPLTAELVNKNHTVTVISSSSERRKDIEELSATAAIGSLEDTGFLTDTFTGADAAYCMIPPNNYFDQNLDLHDYYRRIAGNYAAAVQKSGVKQVVYLSSIGAHLTKGSGAFNRSSQRRSDYERTAAGCRRHFFAPDRFLLQFIRVYADDKIGRRDCGKLGRGRKTGLGFAGRYCGGGSRRVGDIASQQPKNSLCRQR